MPSLCRLTKMRMSLSLLTFCFFISLSLEAANPFVMAMLKGQTKLRNPVLTDATADPSVLRVQKSDGVHYYMVVTSGNSDIPIYHSRNLINWNRIAHAFGGSDPINERWGPFILNGKKYCNIWAPEIYQLGNNSYQLTFTATRHGTEGTMNKCPKPNYGMTTYVAWSNKPEGPYAIGGGGPSPIQPSQSAQACPVAIRDQLPTAFNYMNSPNCHSIESCEKEMRLDSSLWKDPQTSRYWMTYSWYFRQRSPLQGQYTSTIEMDPNNPFAIKCTPDNRPIRMGSVHDQVIINQLLNSCPSCNQNFSFVTDKFGNPMRFEGRDWGVSEGGSLMRKGNYVYTFLSGAAWDSPHYSTYWIGAPSVEELSIDNPNRIAGRLLLPGPNSAFGHGYPVLGPSGRNWYYLHHSLENISACQERNECRRILYVSPIEFEDRNDGKGSVYIKVQRPYEKKQLVIE